jgi:hypothetical protein
VWILIGLQLIATNCQFPFRKPETSSFKRSAEKYREKTLSKLE